MTGSFWLRLFNIRAGESAVVKQLFWMQFFQGMGIAFFSTAAYTLFLHEFSISELPKEFAYLFVFSAFLLWITGFIYAQLEHKLNIITLSKGIILFMTVSMILFRLGFHFVHTDAYYYGMLSWFTVLYLLNNLEFWAIAALQFDVRQSKRLFGVISAGDIPAKFFGYVVAVLIVKYIGPENLLWIGAASMLYSIRYIYNIEKSDEFELRHHAEHNTHHHGHATESSINKLLKHFSGNALIRKIATFTVIVSACFIIINYTFYSEVKKRFETDIQLAQFISLFLAGVSITALIVKLILTSRLLNRLGIIRSLLITPLLMLFFISVFLVTENMSITDKFIFYVFGASAIIIDISRISINTPVFLILMQPLGTHERLRAHTVVKGIMDPFAYLLTGVSLLLFLRFRSSVSLSVISYGLLAVGLLWIFAAYRLNKEYINTLVKTISTRYFGHESFTISSQETLNRLKDKMMNGTELEAIYILKMLESQNNEESKELILSALQHTSDRVQKEAVRLSRALQLKDAIDPLVKIFRESKNSELVVESIYAYCLLGGDINFIIPLAENPDPSIQNAAITGLLMSDKKEIHNLGERMFNHMIDSADPEIRINAASLLANFRDNKLNIKLIRLLNDASRAVQDEAIHAAGQMATSESVSLVIQMIKTHEKEVLNALYAAGETALPAIMNFLLNQKIENKLTGKLFILIGRIGGENAHEILLELLASMPQYEKHVIRALQRSRFKVSHIHHENREKFETLIFEYLIYGSEILYMQRLLDPDAEKYDALMGSLNLELTEIRDTLLDLFSFLFNRDNINQIRSGLDIKKKESVANALELVEMTVKREFANYFNTLFETGDINQRCRELRPLISRDIFNKVESILEQILGAEKFDYNAWTRACSLYISKKHSHNIRTELIRRYLHSENLLLAETAKYAV